MNKREKSIMQLLNTAKDIQPRSTAMKQALKLASELTIQEQIFLASAILENINFKIFMLQKKSDLNERHEYKTSRIYEKIS